MATTFTGLKLQGQLGKFGRIEISDISAYVELPDGKVLSGTEWGNLLLWDGGFIKVEISRKGKKCHNVSIISVYFQPPRRGHLRNIEDTDSYMYCTVHS